MTTKTTTAITITITITILQLELENVQGLKYRCKSAIRWWRPLASMIEKNIGIQVSPLLIQWQRKTFGGVDSWKTVHPSAKVT